VEPLDPQDLLDLKAALVYLVLQDQLDLQGLQDQ
jgi:hypothetical protein